MAGQEGFAHCEEAEVVLRSSKAMTLIGIQHIGDRYIPSPLMKQSTLPVVRGWLSSCNRLRVYMENRVAFRNCRWITLGGNVLSDEIGGGLY